MSQTIEEEKILEIIPDDSLKPVWVDHINLAIREDDICAIRLSTNLPDGLYEQIRFMTNVKQLKEFIVRLCESTNFYPKKVNSKKGKLESKEQQKIQ